MGRSGNNHGRFSGLELGSAFRCSRAGRFQCIFNEMNYFGERVVIRKMQIFAAGDAILCANGREQLSLLDSVDTEIGFQIELQVKYFDRVTGLFTDSREQISFYLLSAWSDRIGGLYRHIQNRDRRSSLGD